MKKLLTILLVILLTLTFGACSSQQQESPSETAETAAADTPVSGGWTLYENNGPVGLPDAVQTAFNLAASGQEVLYTPIAYIGTQVVAGNNYAILCQAEPISDNTAISFKVLIIYADLQGNAELTNVADFNIADYTQGEGKSPEQLAGGWSAPEEVTSLPLSEDAQIAFDNAVSGYSGNELKPMALLGTQVVAGTNYAILCHSTLATAEPVSSIQLATVYADLEGNSEITNVCTIDAADFNK